MLPNGNIFAVGGYDFSKKFGPEKLISIAKQQRIYRKIIVYLLFSGSRPERVKEVRNPKYFPKSKNVIEIRKKLDYL
jgi:hypothetical protein